VGELTRDSIIDNITLYWLTGTGASAARSYLGERTHATALAAGQAPSAGLTPRGLHDVPDEIFQAPRSWVERSYPNVTYFNKAEDGAATSPPGGARALRRARSGPHSGRCDEPVQ